MHNSATLYYSWLCSQVQQTTPDHTQLWVLGVVSGATDLNLSTRRGQCNNFDSICYVELLINNLGGIFTAQNCASGEQFSNLLVHSKTSF